MEMQVRGVLDSLPLFNAASSKLAFFCARLTMTKGDIGNVVQLGMKMEHILLSALASHLDGHRVQMGFLTPVSAGL